MKKILLSAIAVLLAGSRCIQAESLLTPATSSHFTKWTDEGGAVSYILKHQAALQSTGYYTQKMYTSDGRFLWFIADDIGTKRRDGYLGVVDFTKDEVRLFPEARFDPSSPLVDLQTGDCYYVESRENSGTEAGWKINRISPDGKITYVNLVPRQPSESKSNPRQIVSHLTFNASRTALGFDTGNYRGSNRTYAGIVPLDGSPAVVWHVYNRRMNHAQMNPTDDDLMFIAEDYYDHQEDGKTTRKGVDNRMWLLRKDGTTWPLFTVERGRYNSHEWWDVNGRDLWFTDRRGKALGGKGTGFVDITTGKTTLVWPDANDISESSASQRYLVGDNYKQWSKGRPVKLMFFDAQTKKTTLIATSLPAPTTGRPHQPNGHFELNDTWIAYTTSVDGKLGLALSPVEPLQRATQ